MTANNHKISLKSYVQDQLRKDGERVSALILDQGAYVYVCGGIHMATQVEDTLIRLIGYHGNMNQDQANMFFKRFKVRKTTNLHDQKNTEIM